MRRGQCAEALDLDGPQPGRARRQPVAERVEIPLEQRFPWISGAALMVLPSRA
jgi:hypothetical protein